MTGEAARYFILWPPRLTLRECWRLAPGVGTFFQLLLAKLELTHWDPFAVCCPTAWPGVAPSAVPPDVAAAWADPLDRLRGEGFRPAAYGSLPVLAPDVQHEWLALLLHPDGVTGASIADVRAPGGRLTVIGLTTRFTDGTFGVTTNGRSGFDPPPDRVYRFATGRPADVVYARHREHVAGWEAAGKVVAPFGPDEGPAVTVQLAVRHFEHLADRGAVVELDDAEIARHRRLSAARMGHPPGVAPFPPPAGRLG